jgi:hypothetical protein
MTCDQLRLIGDKPILETTLAERTAARRHVRACAACQRLVMDHEAKSEPLSPEARAALTRLRLFDETTDDMEA